MKTVIKYSSRMGGEMDRIELSEHNATTEAIAKAAIRIISSYMSLREGDYIEVVEEKGRVRK